MYSVFTATHLLEKKEWKWFLFPVFKAIKIWKFSWRGGGDKSFFLPIQHNWEANNTVHSHMQFTNNQSIHKCLTINALILRTNLRPNFECFNFISIHFLLNILNTMAHKCVCQQYFLWRYTIRVSAIISLKTIYCYETYNNSFPYFTK